MTVTTGVDLGGVPLPEDGGDHDHAAGTNGGQAFLDGKLAEVLLGKYTVTYLKRRREILRRSPRERLEGESRWEALDSDAPDPGPYAMLDEKAGALMTSPEYREALTCLRHSFEVQPILAELADQDAATTTPPNGKDPDTGTPRPK